jgi:hypothetical protein
MPSDAGRGMSGTGLVREAPNTNAIAALPRFLKILQTFYKVCIDNFWVAATYWPRLRVHPK